MRVIRGAEIGSDHHLVLMKVKIGGRHKMKRKESSCRLRSERLRTKEGKVRFLARLGHQMYKVKHLTAWENVERALGEFKGCSWRQLKFFGEKKVPECQKENEMVE